ncbi:MAG: TetR/AcrR family transcriptional regulator [Verrucomicrobia bacterium]|nr:MAG: TetR/AcrR family transcriptional regulator [Verrucomicrobiota bacterium]
MSPAPAAHDTKTAILDAAEAVFAEVGLARASIRRIVQRAGVNLAAVHYHFGSKEGLIEAVFNRRVAPVNARRLELLAAVEAAHPEGALPVEAVLEAFLRPMQEAREADGRADHLRRLYGRLVGEPSESVGRMMSRQFGPVLQRFGKALKRAVPEVPEPVLLWRLLFTVGAAAHLMLDPLVFKKLTRGRCDPRAGAEGLAELIRFAAAGMRAPAAAGAGEGDQEEGS